MEDVKTWDDLQTTITTLVFKFEQQKKATKYCLEFIRLAMGEKVTADDYKHVMAKVSELEG